MIKIRSSRGVKVKSSSVLGGMSEDNKARLASMLLDEDGGCSNGGTIQDRFNEFISEIGWDLDPKTVTLNGTLFFDLNAEMEPVLINAFNEQKGVNYSEDTGIGVPVKVNLADLLIKGNPKNSNVVYVPRGATYFLQDLLACWAEKLEVGNDVAAQAINVSFWLDDAWDVGEEDMILDVSDSERVMLTSWK